MPRPEGEQKWSLVLPTPRTYRKEQHTPNNKEDGVPQRENHGAEKDADSKGHGGAREQDGDPGKEAQQGQGGR